jgi:hypothetical protein
MPHPEMIRIDIGEDAVTEDGQAVDPQKESAIREVWRDQQAIDAAIYENNPEKDQLRILRGL